MQTDVRDGTDYSANFSYEIDAFGGELSFDGFYVHTERTQNEDSIEYNEGIVDTDEIISLNDNDVEIEQDSFSLNGGYSFANFGGETRIKAGFARFTNEAFEFEDEISYDGFPVIEEFESTLSQTDLTDEEFKFKVEHERDLSDTLSVEFGVHYENKERENLVTEADEGVAVEDGDTIPSPIPPRGSFVTDALEAVDGGDNTIERERIDPYVMLSGEAPGYQWELGLRYETTEVTITDRTVGESNSATYEALLPSAHIKIPLTENDRLFASVARTVRNPSFAFLSPAVLTGELGDNDFRGNPFLEQERAWGVDVGYERRLGRTGVAGVNVFWRDVSDLIEVFNTGEEGDDGPGTFIYSARNTGEGQVWGIEFDLSSPLTIVGLPNTGVFVNYSWLDSDVQDEFGGRMFNSQAESVFNVGFIHDIPTWGAAFGATYRDQGDAYSRVVAEEVTTLYGADLEVFVEKRLGERFTLRLTGSNLLDETKDETFNKFDNAADQRTRDFDEYELETESAGPVFQLIGRLAF
ncbi:MAG: TonB-dependent receptor [Hyphomonadaceae bacterium]|nr:TonB-dependent receptor [Hyphomonadaceae bacterium]